MPKPTSLLKGFEKTVKTAKPNPGKRQVIFDEATTGLALIVSPKGKKTLSIVARGPDGKQVWKSIGEAGKLSVTDARQKAREGVERIKDGLEPFPEEKPPAPAPEPETFKIVAERFVTRWVDKGGRKQDGVPLRSKGEIERQMKAYVYPAWQDKPFLSIRRGQVTELMDELVDNRGAVQADRVLATLTKLFNWYRQYDEHFVSPIIPEMRRSGSYTDRARKRVLSDDEIKAVWTACDDLGAYGGLVRVALLTGQRKAKLAQMRWQDIADDGTWTIPTEAREKNNPGALKLPAQARAIIDRQAKVKDNPFVFVGRGKRAFNSFSAGKRSMDAKVDIPDWVFHDLRRTAKSLMARAGVRPDISERVLGHVIGGVEGTYDRHGYADEKAAALEALAQLVDLILDPPGENVVRLEERVA
jgi:integrase